MSGESRALAVVAHPDDIEVNAAGTIAKWVQHGTAVTYLLVTSGDAGGSGSIPACNLAAVRRAEQLAAAELLGVHDVRFLEGHRDGTVQVTDQLICEIVKVIREIRPQRVMSMSPERDWRRLHQGHPDHLAVGEATIRAVYPASRNPFAYSELLEAGLAPWTVDELWIQAHPSPNHAEDVTALMDLKSQAVLAHTSQFPAPDEILDLIRRSMLADAATFGMGRDRLAEAFLRVPTR